MIRWIQNLNERTVLIVLVLVAIVSLAFSALSHWLDGSGAWWGWADSAFQNFSTEMMGAVVTFALFELVVGVRNEKKSLILQLRSKDNATALNALEQIRENGWDKDGTIIGAKLRRANLQGANFRESQLQYVILESSNLQGANLWRANLENASLGEINLQQAILVAVNLKKANLLKANLEAVNLREANLYGAKLEMAQLKRAYLGNVNLKNAKLTGAVFDEKTVLPNEKYWSPETDMRRFTDPHHPNFWQPDWVKQEEKGDE